MASNPGHEMSAKEDSRQISTPIDSFLKAKTIQGIAVILHVASLRCMSALFRTGLSRIGSIPEILRSGNPSLSSSICKLARSLMLNRNIIIIFATKWIIKNFSSSLL